MKIKKVIIFYIFLFISSAIVFAQNERSGTIIGTFGTGGGFAKTVETTGMFSFVFDLNLVSRAGVTLCLADIIGFSSTLGWVSQNIMFGAGYHYMMDRWNVGGAILLSPTAQDMLLAGKINGGYYFTDNIGITGMLIYTRTVTGIHWDISMFNAFAGVSVKLF
jgi:hypothetical protein